MDNIISYSRFESADLLRQVDWQRTMKLQRILASSFSRSNSPLRLLDHEEGIMISKVSKYLSVNTVQQSRRL
jgi:hypothetical protein